MTCRNCKEELPAGTTSLCPFCGTKQEPYITPRSQTKTKRKTRRSSFLSMLSVFFVIAVVCILIPFLREQNRKADAAAIQERYDELIMAEDKESQSWMDEVSYWVASVSRYKSSYPGDEAGIAEQAEMQKLLLDKDIKQSMIEDIETRIVTLEQYSDRSTAGYMTSLAVLQAAIQRYAGLYPEDAVNKARFDLKLANLSEGTPGVTPGEFDDLERLEAIEQLLRITKESIIDFEPLIVDKDENGGIRVTFRWENLSGVGMENVTVTLRPVDENGESVTDENGKALRAAVRTTFYCAAGEARSSVFTNVWTDPRIASCTIDEVRISYADGSERYLPPEVCTELW